MTSVRPSGENYDVSVDSVGGVDIQIVKQSFGVAGTATPVSPTNPLPVAADIAPYNLSVAQGSVSGQEEWDKFGKNPDVGTATVPEDVWAGGGSYTGFPTGAAETLEIASSSANDTAAGTGARTVTVSGLLDGTGAEMPPVTVALNGTSQVSLGAQTYYRAARIVVATAGSGEFNAGTITLRHTSTTANIFAVMDAGRNQTAVMASTVPLGKTLYVYRMASTMARSSGSAGSASVGFLRREHGAAWQTFRAPEITDSSPYMFSRAAFIAFPERTDIKATVFDVSDNGTIVYAEMDGVLVDN